MNKEQYHLLQAFDQGRIDLDDLDQLFEEKFNIDLYSDSQFLETEIRTVLANDDQDTLELLMNILWIIRPPKKTLPILHQLLLAPNHRYHQTVTKQIQDIADPSSIQYLNLILERGFKDFEYTGSEDGAIAKWFSWALFSIGTEEAVEVLKKHSKSKNREIADEMKYRLTT
ncbi:MAG: hypothetical protein MK212_15070 [Saprospiraceae bacterium]|nr:hypothetical protein [Saprospiraceae bacterium]